MKLDQLYYLKEAIKYNSISIAAEKNYMSQSSVSHSILNLEKELGVDLLKRMNTGVTPTHMGCLVIEKAEDIFGAVNEIVELTKEQRNSGVVNITCIPCICDWIIPKTIVSLKNTAAEIILSMTTAESNTVVRNVSSGLSEFGILIHYDGLERNMDITYTPLFTDEYMLYIGENSPYWNKTSITFEEVITQPYIAYRDEFKNYNGGLTNMIGTNQFENIIFRTDDLDSIKSMITQNDYVAFFPKYMSENDIYLKSGMIRRIPIADRKLNFEVGYVESTKYKIKNINKIVLNVMKEIVRELKIKTSEEDNL